MARQLSTEELSMIEEIQHLGDYEDDQAVVISALSLLRDRLELDRMREHVQIGIDQLNRGEWVIFDPSDGNERMKRARARLAAGEKPSSDVCP